METEQSVSSTEGQDTLVLVLTLWIESVLPHLCACRIDAWETRGELILRHCPCRSQSVLIGSS